MALQSVANPRLAFPNGRDSGPRKSSITIASSHSHGSSDADEIFSHSGIGPQLMTPSLARLAQLDRVINNNVAALPRVDPEMLTARLVHRAPAQTTLNPKVLRFVRPTQAQIKKAAIPSEPKLEPLPVLKEYREKKLKKFERSDTPEPEMKKARKSPTTPTSTLAPLHFDKPKIANHDYEMVVEDLETPPPAKFIRGRNHTSGPSLPPIVHTVEHKDFYGMTDVHQIIQVLTDNPKLGFFYMTPAVPKSSFKYHHYNLKLCDHSKVNPTDYCTISLKGVTRMRVGVEVEFIWLETWVEEITYFQKLIKIPLFARFHKWKAFATWRQQTRRKKIFECKTALEDNLFIVNRSLRPALLNVREMSFRLCDMQLCQIARNKTYTLQEFKEAQFSHLSEVSSRLKEFRDLVKEVVRKSCRTALLEAGFSPDDYHYDGIDSPNDGMDNPAQYDMDIFAEPNERMSYTDQANKRHQCRRLTNFIRLVDYLIANTMHVLAVNSIVTLLTMLSDQLQRTPTLIELQAWTKPKPEVKEAEVAEPPKEEKPQKGRGAKALKGEKKKVDKPEEDNVFRPIFLSELLISADASQLFFAPDETLYVEGVGQVLKGFRDTVLRSQNLVPDPYFNAFTQPIINNKFEEKTCGDGPSLLTIFDDDQYMAGVIESTMVAISASFNAANLYAKTFERIKEFYHENQQTDMEAVRNADHDALFFMESLTRYHEQSTLVSSIVEKRPIGMLMVDATALKAFIKPSPERCLDVLHDILPVKAHHEVERLIELSQEFQSSLEQETTTTLEYVRLLTFLDEIPARVEQLQIDAHAVGALYELIDRYKVETPPEDLAVFQTLHPTINVIANAIDKAVADRDKQVTKFVVCLNKDIAQLNAELKEVKKDVQDPKLLDGTVDRAQILKTLNNLQKSMDTLNASANKYRTYQKNFKTEVTKYEELDMIQAELKLKQTLWTSLEEWEELIKQWKEAELATLDPDELSGTTMRYYKLVYQMEKGLPPNGAVPILKERIEYIRDMLPMITDLRNSSLKPRHWDQIEATLEFKFTPEQPLTIGRLIQLDAFQYSDKIQEISGGASSEYSLEQILKKIEDQWKTCEFPVLPYKDSKDVFIIGITDDIQQLLDDSNINIQTVASSRFVGPIKPRVDEWLRQLDLFGKTLEEWVNCQRNWLYLESIFSAPDIQRQLPAEAKMFLTVDKSYKDIMRKVYKVPLAIRAATQPGLYEALLNNNSLLDQILKCLEAYLESKCVIFPRFYFLSNDELLEILAQTRNPLAVQPHLRKCFDAIAKLEFQVAEKQLDADGKMPEGVQYTNDILAMLSPEGEKVGLGKGLKARGNVEDWLGKVEEAMFVTLRRLMRVAIADFETKAREQWVLCHASQVALTVAQMFWCRDVTIVLQSTDGRVHEEMENCEKKCFQDLNNLAAMVRGKLAKLEREVLCALITLDVHGRDIVSEMVRQKVDKESNFEWQKQLRYYWDTDLDNCVIRMSNSTYVYGYEYLGASPRLVITPLTDRCYLCLMGALQLDLGGAPAGPAGTGKTESTKDLAKALAKQCVVFNCSDGLDYKMMGRFFSGLAQSGAWCCFDEFNRIDIEVLSVIAQQLITIRNAKMAKVSRFMFEGREIKLIASCAAFITMNPGYAGRTELPDNLKALFRPISMMVPDYALIAEVILYSEGFESSKDLARKMVQMYKLCSEQLSQQDHYDFGMRAVKSVLVMAGSLKRQNPDKKEDVVLLRALRDSNLPKFLKDDAILFQAILQDLFPGVEIPSHDYGLLQVEIEAVTRARGLQVVPAQVSKVIQFYETMLVRHGVMLVGPTGSGKTTVYQVLADVCKNLHSKGIIEAFYQPVYTHVMNPKSITMDELYGGINKLTGEWKDGLMGITVRLCVQNTSSDHQWIVCDGPVDALWIENMNTVLDDNKLLCLANSERIKFTPFIHMLFEVQDLAVASPATVSRCGMVYIDAEELKWMPYVKSWIEEKCTKKLPVEIVEYLLELFEKYVETGLRFIQRKCTQAMNQVDISKVVTLCKLLECLIVNNTDAVNLTQEKNKLCQVIATVFAFSYHWAIGGNINENNWDAYDSFVRTIFEDCQDVKMPLVGDMWTNYYDFDTRRLEPWEKVVPSFKYNRGTPFFEILVPTVDTVRFGYLLEKLLDVHHSVLFTGNSGVGKSVVARETILRLAQKRKYVPAFINFSAQTSSERTQEMIEQKMEKKRKTVLGATGGKWIVVFVDDLNMPKLDTYGSQPPIELLRQFQDFRGLYDREKLFWKEFQDMTVCSACAPPGGGRNPVSPRFLRHFSMLCLPAPSEHSLKHMFTAILSGFLSTFAQPVRQCCESIILAATEVYQRMSVEFLPTPAKSHYVFNLRDLSKCIQGMLQADEGSVRDKSTIFKLFVHEALRVFHDRLTTMDDKVKFHTIMVEMAAKYFGETMELESFITMPIIFGDFIKPGAATEDRLYEELANTEKLKQSLTTYLDMYNMAFGKDMKLVFFMDAIEHVSRIARIIRQQRGNALLVGVGGTGKQSLTRLASSICGSRCFQIELSRGYDYSAFREDLKKLYDMAGVQNLDTVFLFTDTQIVVEEFLEDINNILNSGEVPNLFEPDEFERCIIGCRPAAKEVGIAEGNRDAIFEFFINRVRNNLHIVLCMSPVGNALRSRCRMFPSLVNCCTIDWFTEWPREALLSVSKSAFQEVELGTNEIKTKISEMCMEIHTSVSDMSETFYKEMKRRYYTTPTSYLELISLYLSMLAAKKKQITVARDKVSNGLTKLAETNILIDKMKITLTALEPELKKKQGETAALMENLVIEQESAEKVRKGVQEDSAAAKAKEQETSAIADDAQKDVDEAMPALAAAVKALDALDKNDISEIRVFNKPPELVQTVMEAVCILLNEKTDWTSAKIVLGDPNFLKKLYEYDKDGVQESTLKKLKKYLENPRFTPDAVEKVSKAAKSLCMWVRAIDLYARVFKTVEPKRIKLAAVMAELEAVKKNLKVQQGKLLIVEKQIANLQESYEHSVNEKQALEDNMNLTTQRLIRAGKLTTALADEKIRWETSVLFFNSQLDTIVGDVFVSAACVAYYGAFTSVYRQRLMATWVDRCTELEIPISSSLNIITVLADPFEIRQWNTDGLPRDDVSTQNAILVTRGRRWPLMIDPQEQANRWVRNKEESSGLKIIKFSDGHFMRTLENAIRIGFPVLLEDVGEFLDPSIEPILLKQTFVLGGRTLIHLGDSDIEYHSSFKLYMTTKLSNPHYLPEICIKVTVINFTVTKTGLEDQLLSEVVSLERPELEDQRNQLIIKINADKNQLKAIEDRILKMLFESEGNILDNEELINTLNDSKVTSATTMVRLAEAEATELMISTAREAYRVVATRGSTLFFVVASMADVDPMYQFSLKYFKNLFNNTIQNSERSKELAKRLKTLLSSTTADVYRNVARGLFEKDKLVFSFMLCVDIMKTDGKITPGDWNYFLRGASGVIIKDMPVKPVQPWLSQITWNKVVELDYILPDFKGLANDMTQTPCWINYCNLMVRANPEKSKDYKPLPPKPVLEEKPVGGEEENAEPKPYDGAVKGHWDLRLTSFQKLIFIRAFQEEKVIFAMSDFVKENLGSLFIEPPQTDLPTLYTDMSYTTPLVFVLSTGSDPMGAFLRFAREKNYQDRVHAISLGQGQGPIAAALIKEACSSGDWVYLQNCHLAASWMLTLEEIVKDIIEKPKAIKLEFRLFLSSMPSRVFPVSVLQNSIKVTNEPPKGVRNNLKRAFNDITPAFFEENNLGNDWRRMVFGLCCFHAIILERKKFGPLGWNIKYDFSDNDRECALLNLQMFCADGVIPWDALIYITGEITFGGRVTDQWDQRCLRIVLNRFFNHRTLEKDYKFSESGIYYAPVTEKLSTYRTYIEKLPLNDEPEIFGLHENANIAFQIQETHNLITTVLEMQPRVGGGSGGGSSDDIVFEMATVMLAGLIDKLDIEEAKKDIFTPDSKGRVNSLTTVLMQECDRFNKLIRYIKESMSQLQKAIKGFVVMSEELENVYNSFINNQVPPSWSAKAYPSLKPLASWMKDFSLRTDFIRSWIKNGVPKSFWLSGFFFPQGFLTGVLQNHARKYMYPIDHLTFEFHVYTMYRDQAEISLAMSKLKAGERLTEDDEIKSPADGVLVHGLFMDGFRWNDEHAHVEDSRPGEMYSTLPIIHMNPKMDYEAEVAQYRAPLYKTTERYGVLSTTGHSTNFVVTVTLPASQPPDYWISKGSALLCQLSI